MPSSTLLSLRRARRNPIEYLSACADGRPITAFSLGSQRAFLVNDPDAAHDVLIASDAKFRKPPALDRTSRLLGRGLLTADQRLHAVRRRTIQPVFHRERMVRYAGAIVSHARNRTGNWTHDGTLDISNEMTTLALGVVGEVLFSTDLRPLAPELRRILSCAVDALDPLVVLVAPMRRLRPVRRRLQEIVQGLIDARLTGPNGHDDLLSLLLDASGPEATPEQLHDDVTTMLLAGHDTISNALTWTWGWLGELPAVEERLHAEVDEALTGRPATFADISRLPYTRAVLAESLRLNPPAWIIARTAIDDHRIADTVVPRGALVVISPYLLHRDARFFSDPLTFNPDRWMTPESAPAHRMAYLPFGAGRRGCIGEPFAWMEGVLVLASIAQAWRLRPLAGPPSIEPRITLRPRGPLPMRALLRTSHT